MKAFEPYTQSLERYLGRRLIALLAALALADIVILMSMTVGTVAFTGIANVGGIQDLVRVRALEVVNAQGQPVLVATADKTSNGVLWVSAANGKGGVSLSTDEVGNGHLVVNTASGTPLISAVASDLEGGGLQIVDALANPDVMHG